MVNLTHTSCVLVGDIHGETQSLLDDFERENIIFTDTDLVLLGDIGLGFHYYSYHEMDWMPNDDVETLKILDDWCEANFNDVWVLRGNHDDPKKFNDDFFSNFKHVHYLKDGEEVIGKNGKHYLTVPGAISVDRVYRREYISYWTDETINEKVYIDMEQKHFDGVFAHTGPTPPVCEKSSFIIRMKEEDPLLEGDIANERRIVEDIIVKFDIKNWYGGHYHLNQTFETINSCVVKVIDINTPYQLY